MRISAPTQAIFGITSNFLSSSFFDKEGISTRNLVARSQKCLGAEDNFHEIYTVKSSRLYIQLGKKFRKMKKRLKFLERKIYLILTSY